MRARDDARERAATLRAGLVASAVYNVHRRKGAPAIKPTDFLESSARPIHYVEPAELRQIVRGWVGMRKH
jgi:hypothetical protein